MRWYFRTSRSKLSCRRAGRGRRVLRRLRVRSLGLPRQARLRAVRPAPAAGTAAPGIGPQGPPPDGKGVVAASKGHTPGGKGCRVSVSHAGPCSNAAGRRRANPTVAAIASGRLRRLAARIPGTGRHAASVTAPPEAPAPRARRRRPAARPPTAARMPPPRRRPGRRARTRHEAASPRQARPGARARNFQVRPGERPSSRWCRRNRRSSTDPRRSSFAAPRWRSNPDRIPDPD